jgi:hypothetical protein
MIRDCSASLAHDTVRRYSLRACESQLLSRLQSRRLTYFGFEVLSFQVLS